MFNNNFRPTPWQTCKKHCVFWENTATRYKNIVFYYKWWSTAKTIKTLTFIKKLSDTAAIRTLESWKSIVFLTKTHATCIKTLCFTVQFMQKEQLQEPMMAKCIKTLFFIAFLKHFEHLCAKLLCFTAILCTYMKISKLIRKCFWELTLLVLHKQELAAKVEMNKSSNHMLGLYVLDYMF